MTWNNGAYVDDEAWRGDDGWAATASETWGDWTAHMQLDWHQRHMECLAPTDAEIIEACGPEYFFAHDRGLQSGKPMPNATLRAMFADWRANAR